MTKTAKQLKAIWAQVPVDYYQKGVRRNFLQRIWHATKFASFKKITLGKNFKKILDVGCASGYMANNVATLFPNSKVTGIDVYKKAVDFARKAYPNSTFRVADAHKLPFATNSFDLVYSYETIEHVVHPKTVIAEMHRVTKTGGVSILAMDSGSILFRIIWFVWEKTLGKAWHGSHLHPFHYSELESLVKRSKFTVVKRVFSHFGMEVTFVLRK